MSRLASFHARHRAGVLVAVLAFWAAGHAVQAWSLGSPVTPFQHLCFLGVGAYIAMVSLVMANPVEKEVSVPRTFKVMVLLLLMAAPAFGALGHLLAPALR